MNEHKNINDDFHKELNIIFREHKEDIQTIRNEHKDDIEKVRDENREEIQKLREEFEKKYINIIYKLDEIKNDILDLTINIKLLMEKDINLRKDFDQFKSSFFKSIIAIAGSITTVIGAIIWEFYKRS